MLESAGCLAGLTSPIEIGTNPQSLLWMFPLLLAVAVIYKTTRMRVLILRRFVIECLVLFATLSVFMAVSILVLNLLQRLITS
jgi:hypothetical protein